MNNAKMWLVVPPAVGVPVFLGAVAVGSFAVHVAVLSNTSWVSDFLSGKPLGTGDEVAAAAKLVPETAPTRASYVVDHGTGGREVSVVLPDGTIARAILQENEVLAAADAPPLIATD